LTPPVALIAEEVSFNRPALFASDSRLQNKGTVLALKALKMIIPVHCPQPWSLCLSFLWHNSLFAAGANHTELLGITLCAVNSVVGVQGDWFPLHVLAASHAEKTAVVEGDSSNGGRVGRGERLVATGTGSAFGQLKCLEVLLTENPAMEGEKLSS